MESKSHNAYEIMLCEVLDYVKSTIFISGGSFGCANLKLINKKGL